MSGNWNAMPTPERNAFAEASAMFHSLAIRHELYVAARAGDHGEGPSEPPPPVDAGPRSPLEVGSDDVLDAALNLAFDRLERGASVDPIKSTASRLI
jgi:hypothetical protein